MVTGGREDVMLRASEELVFLQKTEEVTVGDIFALDQGAEFLAVCGTS